MRLLIDHVDTWFPAAMPKSALREIVRREKIWYDRIGTYFPRWSAGGREQDRSANFNRCEPRACVMPLASSRSACRRHAARIREPNGNARIRGYIYMEIDTVAHSVLMTPPRASMSEWFSADYSPEGLLAC